MAHLTSEEKMELLSRVAKMCMPTHDGEAPPFVELMHSETNRSVAAIVNVGIKAVVELNKMEGHYAPEKKQFDFTNDGDMNQRIKDQAKQLMIVGDSSQ